MMDNWCAPQWADLTRSPQVLSDTYFEVEHEVHEPLITFKPNAKSSVPCKKENITELSVAETNFDDSLEPVEKPCTSVAYFIPHEGKKQSDDEIDKEKNLNNAMKDLKLNKKTEKIHQAWSIPAPELTSAFKKSAVSHKAKPAPERFRINAYTTGVKNQVSGKSCLKNNQNIDIHKKKENTQHTALVKEMDKPIIESNGDSPKCVKSNVSKERLSYKIVSGRKQSNVHKTKKRSLSKPYPRVLTCQYRRQSLKKYRRCSNQFISMAEAISRFQNGTPQRFRTISNKNFQAGSLMKLKQQTLKLTHPVSPTLRSKKRTRPITILNQQEREKLELEEMKKHQIKANPVPINILKGPCVLKKVPKKPATVTEEFRLTKTRYTTGPHLHSQSAIDNRENNCKSSLPITRSTSASNVSIKKDNASTESSGKNIKPLPIGFVARNKQYQMKKEEKLKNLQVQETNKIKNEFHARPAPKFTKPINPVKEQSEKKRIVPCPFSFEKRDKSLAKKKEELVKHKQEQNKEIAVFHANPAPTFKPVLVHGLSKESIQSKEKTAGGTKKLVSRQTKSCFDQENKQPNVIVSVNAIKKGMKQCAQEFDKKQSANTVKVNNAVNVKTEKPKIALRTKFELNTEKRAKERTEFEEKMRKKEEQLKAKKEAEEKNKMLREKSERTELRRMTEVKARPMPIYKPLTILKSTKPPSSPRSPAWASRNKIRNVS
nr:targeting protein for Xklp2-like isoform X1 [Osmia lignaria]XP_034190196.1 targeting protein for Xklp2-like isoform X1 [Osmia lignaria]